MSPIRGQKKAISFLGCLLVLASLVAPRLVVHRHSDFETAGIAEHALAHTALAAHVERFHGSAETCVAPTETHIHWAFSFPPGELPEDSATDRGLMIADSPCDAAASINASACLVDDLGFVDALANARWYADRVVGSQWVEPSSRRILFCVWNI
jgi:hypothetical protein